MGKTLEGIVAGNDFLHGLHETPGAQEIRKELKSLIVSN
jgi:hypothetical protein